MTVFTFKNHLLPVITGLLFFFAQNMHALASEDTPSPAPTIESILSNSGISTRAYMDASFIGHNQTPDPNAQVTDTARNSFGIHQIGLVISKLPQEGYGEYLNLLAGSDAGVICSYGLCSSGPTGNGATPFSGGNFDIPQAYLQYATGPWTFIGGKFASLAGAESYDSSQDSNITRSILYAHQPFTHTGIRTVNTLDASTNLTLGINNGWDQVTAMTSSKTLELGISKTFTPQTSLVASIYTGDEAMNQTGTGFTQSLINGNMVTTGINGSLLPTEGGRSGLRTIFDTVITSNLTSATTVILDADHVTQQNALIGINQAGTETYWGVAGYLNHQFNEQYRLSLRGETLHDDQGVAIAAQGTPPGANTLREVTLTLGYDPTSHFELRSEIREDSATKGVFLAENGLLQQNMTTYGIQGIYKF